ncbi:MAG TPA: PKD domain-containing protein [Polyangiaceae bacterium]|nr:PKD domain-containing protein [Polyangiaceae bacterium]
MIRTEKLTILALGFCGVTSLAMTSCGQGGDQGDSPSSSNEETAGAVDLALQLGNGTILNSASYTITGPGGFSKTGSIDVSRSNRLSARISGLPAGTGFSISVTAATTDAATNCSGSASFDVVARRTVPVNVPVACREAPRTGSILVGGTVNLCPTIDGIGASPAEANVGGNIALSALAHDSDAGPSALSYAWTASSGTLSDSSAKNPTLTCTTPGTVTLGLTVSDGDPVASCAATESAEVTCSVAPETPGTYVAGDFHNHSTCSDGSTSMQKKIKKSMDKVETPWGLDWFIQAGHGGQGSRNCTLVEDASLSTPAYPFIAGQGPTTTWVNSGITPQGDVSGSGANRNMWRWQSLQQFQYPLVEYLNAYRNEPLFLGLETVNPGHEHTSMSIFTGQIPAALDTTPLPTTPGYTAIGNANALAQWEYCFDRNDGDRSRGAANQWDCSVPGSLNAADPNWNATAMKLIPATGPGVGLRGHDKGIESVKWMKELHPETSYFVPAHLERAGVFNPNGNNGYNIEHLRDFNNAAPRVAFGMETQPGHGASDARGEYTVLRNNFGTGVGLVDSAGGTTYGGTGVYGAQVGGVWDALLGEGRNWWFFASSDWHNRGSFGPDDRRTSQDFYPGEYQRNYTLVRSGAAKIRPQAVVDGLRSGNNWASSGQIIDRLAFVVCTGKSDAQVAQIAANAAIGNVSPEADGCATMGEKLQVASGADLVVGVALRDPAGKSFSPYTFANPSLAQIGVTQPLDEPVLDHVDLIGGLVTGFKTPGAPDYSGEWPRNTNWLRADGSVADLSVVPDAAKNTSTSLLRAFSAGGMSAWDSVTSHIDGSTFLTMTFRISAVTASQYVRLRGTNLPAAVPFETDASGNPLPDVHTNAVDPTRLRIPCSTPHSAGSQFDGCPDHMTTATGTDNPIAGQKAVTFDIAAWADLWFYSNPIYIEVAGSTVVAGVN